MTKKETVIALKDYPKVKYYYRAFSRVSPHVIGELLKRISKRPVQESPYAWAALALLIKGRNQ